MIAAAVLLAFIGGAGPNGLPCVPAEVLAAGAAADGAPVRVWKDDAAARAFALIATQGFPFVGELVMAVPTAAGVMLGIVHEGAICHVITIPDSEWRTFRIAVEGLPL